MKRFGEALLHIHGARDAESLSPGLLRAMRGLLPADICVVDWYGFQGLPVHTLYDPVDGVPATVNEAVHAFAHQNPVYVKSRGFIGSISDFLSRADWHRTALYAEAYSQVGQEDGMVLDVSLQQDCRLSLIVSRSRRGFSMEDRAKIALLEPHVREVFQRVQAQDQLRRQLETPVTMPAVLSAREREVLLWISEGKTNAEIGLLLGIRTSTVKKHLENLYRKLGVENRHAAALLALRLRG
jgi:DNA-binding CsgD family transcriptional regulator